KLAHDAVIDGLVQRERAAHLDRGHRGGRELRLRVAGGEPQGMIKRRLDVSIGVEIDGRVENASAIEVAERRQIGAAPRETKAQGSASADDQWCGPFSRGISDALFYISPGLTKPSCAESLGRCRFSAPCLTRISGIFAATGLNS